MRSSLKLLCCISFGAAILLAAVPSPEKAQVYTSNFENVLGTSLELKVYAGSEAEAEHAESAALNEIDRLDRILSGYKQDSEFSRWMRTRNTAIHVSADLFEVLQKFETWRAATHGALDPSAELIGRVWKTAALARQVPSPESLQRAVNRVQQVHYVLDPVAGTATHLDDAPLVLNSFAKSYIIHKAAVAARVAGIRGIVLNIGGDLVVSGDVSERVTVSDPAANAENDAPLATLRVTNRAVATSGDYRRGIQIGDHWYSHIVDPRTGQPAGNIRSATVVAPDASQAGALATAFNILDPQESRLLASTVNGAEFLIIGKNGTRYESEGWRTLADNVPAAAERAPARSKDKLWDPNYELSVDFELATIEGTRVRRPFLAVWVTDLEKNPVRNVTVWYNKPRWLRDLTTWFKLYGAGITPEINPLSSSTGATRSPGKYSVKWDGKNDKGELVKAGDYIINLEVAREHGTYQLLTKQMKFSGKAVKVTLPANVEIASAALDYRKK